MAFFVLEYRYTDPERRAAARPRHLEHIERLHADGRVVMAGPLVDASGAVVVYRAADAAEARRMVAEDPYTIEGVSTDATLREWSVLYGAPQDR
jgi:uncharacterized protein YciI